MHHNTCPTHDTGRDGQPLTREGQFNLDYENQARWAIHPLDKEAFRRKWDRLHQGCAQ